MRLGKNKEEYRFVYWVQFLVSHLVKTNIRCCYQRFFVKQYASTWFANRAKNKWIIFIRMSLKVQYIFENYFYFLSCGFFEIIRSGGKPQSFFVRRKGEKSNQRAYGVGIYRRKRKNIFFVWYFPDCCARIEKYKNNFSFIR